MNLAGCRTREQAEAYRGDDVRLRLDAAPPLPPGRHYQWQILGLRVVTDDGNPLGHVRRILETGANDVYVVENDLGEELLLPAITSVIRGVDLEQGVLTAHLLPGLVDVTRRKVHREE
jgi:16S rRNA processing protein RimM